MAIALALAQLIARADGELRRLWIATLAVTGVGFALLLPWPVGYLRAGDRLAALGFAFRTDLGFSNILRFQTGPNGAGAGGWVIAGAALLVLFLATGPRLVWATRAWVLALVSFAFVWVPSRFFPDAPMPAVEGLLVPAALGVSLAVGLGVAAFIEDVRQLHFGWRQVAAIGGAIALSFPVLAFAVDATGGRWHMPAADWNQNLSWMRSEEASGQFRVLWLGDPDVLPVDPVVHGDVGYGITNDGPGDVRTNLPPPSGGASARVGAAVDLLRRARQQPRRCAARHHGCSVPRGAGAARSGSRAQRSGARGAARRAGRAARPGAARRSAGLGAVREPGVDSRRGAPAEDRGHRFRR